MSAIKWTKELLEECRNDRGVVFGMMSKEAQEAIASVHHIHREFYFHCGWDDDPTTDTCAGNAFRLRPDWTPPELEERPFVDVPVRKSNDDVLLYRTPIGNDKQLVTAASCVNFAGYVYANTDTGTTSVCSSVRLPSGTSDGGRFEAPVAVRFWKAEK